MPALLDQLLDNEQQTQADALATYRELLARRHEPQDGDADTLRRVMALLRITPRDFEGDGHALANVASLSAKILPPDQLREVSRRRDEARLECEKSLRELLHAMVDRLDDIQHGQSVEMFLARVGAPKGTVPFQQRRDAIVAKWVDAQNEHMTKTGLHDQNSRQADAIRRQHPRAFAD
jgi:hypothetical protein